MEPKSLSQAEARRGERGFTLAELLLLVGILAALAALLLPLLGEARREAYRIRCRNNLIQLSKGLAFYLNMYGENRWYPCPLGRGAHEGDYNGAEWLASLYWTGLVPDPGLFLCPSSGDANHDGKDLGADGAVAGTFGSQTVSYAGIGYKSLTDKEGKPTALGADILPTTVAMASDDTQGAVNHPGQHGGMSVMFFDTHVEFRTAAELPGWPDAALPWPLRN